MPKCIRLIFTTLAVVFLLLSESVLATGKVLADDQGKWHNPYQIGRIVDKHGRQLDIVQTPVRPPAIRATAAALPQPVKSGSSKELTDVPAFDWCYGCSPTAAGMLAGYYDQPSRGYTNMYSGPANGGVCPMNNVTAWGSGKSPLVATQMNLDQLTVKGHVDDFWKEFRSYEDPYFNSSPQWTPHQYADCTGDYMGANQFQFQNCQNLDGETTFYRDPINNLPVDDYPDGAYPGGPYRDGCHGLKLFMQSRGYTVASNYTQVIAGFGDNPAGFSYTQFKAQIDAGRPVLIQLNGHTMLGYGYADPDTIAVHDTWDNSPHTMQWGNYYVNPQLQHWGVTVMELEPAGFKAIGANITDTPNRTNNANNFILTQFAASSTGNMTQFKLNCSAAGNVKVAIYSDSGGQPGTLLNAVNTSTPVVAGWNTITFPSTALTSGASYWLALNSSANIVGVKSTTTGNRRFKPFTFSTFTFPATAGTGFTTNTTYYDLTAGWGLATLPSITNSSGATHISSTEATLNGNLTSDGGSDTTITVYYGTTDYGSSPNGWEHNVPLGTVSPGPLSTSVDNLTPGASYYYRYSALNSVGISWAASSASFTAVDQLIGANASDTPNRTNSSNYFTLSQFAASLTGNMTQFKLNCSVAGNVKVAIYADNAGAPGALLNAVNTSTPVAVGWNTITFPSTALTFGTSYWLAYNSSANSVGVKSTTTSNRRYKAATFSTFTFPATAGTGFTVPTTIYYDLTAGCGIVIAPTPPGEPTPLSPGAAITFEWSAVTGASYYQLQVNTASDFSGTSMFDDEVDNTSNRVSGLSLGVTYYWRVRAGNAYGWSTWCTTGSVTANQ